MLQDDKIQSDYNFHVLCWLYYYSLQTNMDTLIITIIRFLS